MQRVFGKNIIGIDGVKMKIVILILSVFYSSISVAWVHIPSFDEFPVKVFTGNRSGVKISTAKDRQYASRLRQLASQPVNFAGHYVLVSWGCGASCVMAAAIDAKGGKVIWLPFTLCCWPLDRSEPLEFRSDSRLLVAHGSRNEVGGGDYYYRLDPSGFRLVGASEHGGK